MLAVLFAIACGVAAGVVLWFAALLTGTAFRPLLARLWAYASSDDTAFPGGRHAAPNRREVMSLDAAEQRRVRPAQHGSDGRRALVDLPRPGQNRPLPLATPAAADTGPWQPHAGPAAWREPDRRRHVTASIYACYEHGTTDLPRPGPDGRFTGGPGQPPGWAEDDDATIAYWQNHPRWDDDPDSLVRYECCEHCKHDINDPPHDRPCPEGCPDRADTSDELVRHWWPMGESRPMCGSADGGVTGDRSGVTCQSCIDSVPAFLDCEECNYPLSGHPGRLACLPRWDDNKPLISDCCGYYVYQVPAGGWACKGCGNGCTPLDRADGLGSCDWGDCDDWAVTTRWSASHGDLPVCLSHVGPDDLPPPAVLDYDAPDPVGAIKAVPIADGIYVPLTGHDDTLTDMRPWQPHAGPPAWRAPDLPRPGFPETSGREGRIGYHGKAGPGQLQPWITDILGAPSVDAKMADYLDQLRVMIPVRALAAAP